MNMTGPSNPFGGGVLGIAPLDCDDEQTHNNITYAFHCVNDQFDASTHGHDDRPGSRALVRARARRRADDIMNPYNAGGDPSFTDVCLRIVQGGIVPAASTQPQCGERIRRRTRTRSCSRCSARHARHAAPTVSITFPLDGQEFDAGTELFLMVDAADDIGVRV